MKKLILGLLLGVLLSFIPAWADWAHTNAAGFSPGDYCKVSGGAACTFTAAPILSSQSVACAGGVLALDPVSPLVYLNANGAACVVTLGESNAVAKTNTQIIVSGTPGIGVVTFPAVSNVHSGPVLCITTGIGLGGSYTIHYDSVNAKYIGTGCTTL